MKQVAILSLICVIGLTSCQFFAPQKKVVSSGQVKNDSITVRKKHFNDDPSAPVEWEVTMKKTPEGTYVKHGKSTRYGKSGKVYAELNYVNNKKEGVSYSYHTNGKVYKEDYYENNRRNGICKRYDRNGALTAEMPYKNGLPGIGLVEYTNLGKPRPVPSISIQKVDKIKMSGTYNLVISLSGDGAERVKSVEFYEGKLIEDKFFHRNLTPIKNISSKKGELKIQVPKGYQVNKNLNIVVVAKTTGGQKLILQKPTSVNVRGV